MEKNRLISWAFFSLLTTPIFLGCSQDYENEEFNGQEVETLANVKRTRAAEEGNESGEEHQVPSNWNGINVKEGRDTVFFGNDFTLFEVDLSWNGGTVGCNVHFTTNTVSAIKPFNATVENTHGDFLWNSALNKVSGHVTIEGHYTSIYGGLRNYIFSQPVDFSVKFQEDRE